MKYIEICIETSGSGVEAVATALLNIGITDTVVADPRDVEDLMEKKQTYDWDYVDDSVVEMMKTTPKVTVYFEDNRVNRGRAEEVKQAIAELKKQQKEGYFGREADFGSLSVTVKTEDDTSWKDKWKEYFKPARISEQIVVKPTWEEYDNVGGFKIIEIDPGMAFGTGTHETTSLCVKMLEKYIEPGDRVLDVGCGSGILSIAAALLNAGDVLGIDIDPTAVEVAKDNIRLNGVGSTAKVQYGDLAKGLDYRANIIVANLMADLVMMLSEDAAAHLRRGGKFISSGILTEKEEEVTDFLKNKGFLIEEVQHDGEWCAICALMPEGDQL